jgi:hypothetical protein
VQDDILSWPENFLLSLDLNNQMNFVDQEKCIKRIHDVLNFDVIDLGQDQIKLIRPAVLQESMSFIKKLVAMCLKYLPFHDETIKAFECLQPRYRANCAGVKELLLKFPILYHKADYDNILQEFEIYRFLENYNLPSENQPLDKYWGEVAMRKELKIQNLATFLSKVCGIPNSNTQVERLFSTLNSVKSVIRNRLNQESLRAILVSKNYFDEEEF